MGSKSNLDIPEAYRLLILNKLGHSGQLYMGSRKKYIQAVSSLIEYQMELWCEANDNSKEKAYLEDSLVELGILYDYLVGIK